DAAAPFEAGSARHQRGGVGAPLRPGARRGPRRLPSGSPAAAVGRSRRLRARGPRPAPRRGAAAGLPGRHSRHDPLDAADGTRAGRRRGGRLLLAQRRQRPALPGRGPSDRGDAQTLGLYRPGPGMTGPGTAGPGTAGPGTAGPGTAGPGMTGPRTTGSAALLAALRAAASLAAPA